MICAVARRRSITFRAISGGVSFETPLGLEWEAFANVQVAFFAFSCFSSEGMEIRMRTLTQIYSNTSVDPCIYMHGVLWIEDGCGSGQHVAFAKLTKIAQMLPLCSQMNARAVPKRAKIAQMLPQRSQTKAQTRPNNPLHAAGACCGNTAGTPRGNIGTCLGPFVWPPSAGTLREHCANAGVLRAHCRHTAGKQRDARRSRQYAAAGATAVAAAAAAGAQNQCKPSHNRRKSLKTSRKCLLGFRKNRNR